MILMSIINMQSMEDLFSKEEMNQEVILRCALIENLLENDTFPD